MDWGFVVMVILGVVGAALVAAGIVTYRGSSHLQARALAAAAIGAGVVMWAIILFSTPLSVTRREEGPPAPVEQVDPNVSPPIGTR